MDKSWGWMSVIDRLTDGDITKDEEVFKIPYIHCLVRLLYFKDKDEYIEKVNKANESKNKR
jgi:hypothetical protein